MVFPDDNLVLGRFLEMAIDVRLAMTAKILMKNGEVVYQSNYPGLTDAEVANHAHIAL